MISMSKNTTIGVLLCVVGASAAIAAPINSSSLPRATAMGGSPGFASVVERDGPVVYNQAPTSADGYFSDSVGGQFYSQMIADNFTLTSDTVVSGVNWWGSTENFFGPSDYSNFSSFSVMVLDGNFDVVFAQTFATGDTNPVATGVVNLGGGEQFFQSVKFDQTFELTGNTEYWVAIGTTNVDSQGDAWVWSSAAGDGILASDDFGGAGFLVSTGLADDVAFEIQAVPTPGAASLLALAGLVTLRRRR
jgi:hypothetical protein